MGYTARTSIFTQSIEFPSTSSYQHKVKSARKLIKDDGRSTAAAALRKIAPLLFPRSIPSFYFQLTRDDDGDDDCEREFDCEKPSKYHSVWQRRSTLPSPSLPALTSQIAAASVLYRLKISSWNLRLQTMRASTRIRRRWRPLILFVLLVYFVGAAESKCSRGCDLALASFYVVQGQVLDNISALFSTTSDVVVSYNPKKLPNKDSLASDVRINIPLRSCECINGDFLGHTYIYMSKSGDTYNKIAGDVYSNLTTADWLRQVNTYNPLQIPLNAEVNVTVNCSCGDASVTSDYGLFVTYPLRPGENLSSVASELEFTETGLLERYNRAVNFSSGNGLVFVPAKDLSGSYRPLKSRRGLSPGAIAAIAVAGAVVLLLSVIFLYLKVFKKSMVKRSPLFPSQPENYSVHQRRNDSVSPVDKTADSVALVGGSSPGLTGITVDKSVEFSYEELARATNDFSLANKIGEGGFGAVYYAELGGEKAAIKKMDMQASKEFLAELKVLTHVHHLNLVRLIGFCTEGSLFLVYEFIENGNLSQHLRGSSREPLSWATRVQIALDSARGLEYIHEHTVPVYIHRDIKSANILIDKNYHAKVADFGLTKLTEVGSTSLPTRLVGTFGYMPPEYARYGDVSPKIDVYAFGVVLYELISAKEAVVKTDGLNSESKGLVALFENVHNQPDPRMDLPKLVDPRLGDKYPLDSVHKMAQLARACTQENPQLRPNMRSIVVALMTLSSTTEDWDVGSFYENQALVNLMSGR
ncbi:hypothetical protein H6P81_020237 [Aristolochia fimbriata]|uniref:non-specific serine/threonine protein kinase n=1 Tax=Aristolochia fimbriata TaxID=158543 RepID=A0AAV7DX44_ARIFI|nr:hypothetical protein H6P81_020237 [Aristolochia fimbriata]